MLPSTKTIKDIRRLRSGHAKICSHELIFGMEVPQLGISLAVHSRFTPVPPKIAQALGHWVLKHLRFDQNLERPRSTIGEASVSHLTHLARILQEPLASTRGTVRAHCGKGALASIVAVHPARLPCKPRATGNEEA